MRIKRICDAPDKKDGCRILVDRLWPRGSAKRKSKSRPLAEGDRTKRRAPQVVRTHPTKWKEFKKRYAKELEAKQDLVKEIEQTTKKETVTLLYSAKDNEHNNAVALKTFLEKSGAK